MRPTFLLYLTIAEQGRAASRPATRCCTDEPATRTRSTTSPPLRWARKLARAVPASASAFRSTLGSPLPAARVTPGDAVVTSSGETVGRVRDVYVGLGSREPAVAVEPAEPSAQAAVFLLPPGAVRSRRDGVIVLDPSSSRKVA